MEGEEEYVDGGEENSIEFGGENSVVENLAVDGGRKYFGKNRGGGRGLSCTASIVEIFIVLSQHIF